MQPHIICSKWSPLNSFITLHNVISIQSSAVYCIYPSFSSLLPCNCVITTECDSQCLCERCCHTLCKSHRLREYPADHCRLTRRRAATAMRQSGDWENWPSPFLCSKMERWMWGAHVVFFFFLLCVCMRESYTERKGEWEGCIMENDCFHQICRREDSSLHTENEKKKTMVYLWE